MVASGCSAAHSNSFDFPFMCLQGNGTVTPFEGGMDDYTQMVLSEMAQQLLSGDGKIRLQAVEGASRSEAYTHKKKKGEEEERHMEVSGEAEDDGQAHRSEKETREKMGDGKAAEEGGGGEEESGQKEQEEEEKEEGEETEES